MVERFGREDAVGHEWIYGFSRVLLSREKVVFYKPDRKNYN